MILTLPLTSSEEVIGPHLTHDVDQEIGGSNRASEATHRIPRLNDRVEAVKSFFINLLAIIKN